MPYIKQEDRVEIVDCQDSTDGVDVYLDDIIKDLQNHIKIQPDEKKKGLTNYIISRIVAGGMKPEDGWGYSTLSDARGVFTDAGSEFERRLIAGYEERCIGNNGDLPEYRR